VRQSAENQAIGRGKAVALGNMIKNLKTSSIFLLTICSYFIAGCKKEKF